MSFKPPPNFNFREPVSWPSWRQTFQRFRTASELTKKTEEIQVSSLIYSMGPEAEKIFSTFGLTDEEAKVFATVLGKFDEYFTPKRNVIHERAQFHKRGQKETETIEEYVRCLYELSEHAEFPDRDNMIRDRLVLGILDKEMSEKLQLEPKLTLANAITMARQKEAVKAQIKEQRLSNVDALYTGSARGGHPRSERGRGRGRGHPGRGGHQGAVGGSSIQNCKYCGGTHGKRQCPAYGKECRNCRKKNHFAKVCRGVKKVNELFVEEEEEEAFLLSVQSDTYDEPWKTQITIGKNKTHFKIDTGADVSIMTTKTYNALQPKPPLEKTKIILRSTSGVLDCLGKTTLDFTVKGIVYPVTVYITPSPENLLSREAAARMGLVVRVDGVFGELDGNPIKTPPVKIQLQEGAQPYSVHTARRIPIPLLGKVKEELQNMERVGIIKKVDEPTDWCAPIVPVIKPSGGVRICTDFKKLNAAVKRERYMLPAVEDVLHKLKGSAIFSKLDARSGFFQVPLDEGSAKLTTFITPEGRYYYQRLPQGISSAPEIFQKTMEAILKDKENVICFFDDILIHSKNAEDHEKHLQDALKTLEDAGVKLGKEKCQLRKPEVQFLGFIINKDGVRPDMGKTAAILNMADPTNLTELRRFMGMINFLGRYLPNLSTIASPLTELMEKEKTWCWGPPQAEAVAKIKQMATSAPTLAYFDPQLPTVVSADASSYGLGAVLLQMHEGGERPVAFASRTLSKAERHYAQIEKECLASTWACERFEKYLVGLPRVEIITDHKPLVPLMNTKDLSETPLRCQRLLLRLLKFNATAKYLPGKEMLIADALSRCPMPGTEEKSHQDVEAHVREVEASWPVKDATLDSLREKTKEDVELSCAISYTLNGWPAHKQDVMLAARNLYDLRSELSVQDGLLLRGNRIVVPTESRQETLEKIHHGHMGVAKCRERAKQSVWWPQIGRDIKERVASCRQCLEERPSHPKEPLLPSALPDRPFQKVAVDLFDFKREPYVVMTDYYSRYFEVGYLPNQRATTLVGKLKTMFARHGIPETVVSDNGSNLTSTEFKRFGQKWGFQHVTSSPHYAQANGAAENRVKIAKRILRQEDPCLALLTYRATPIAELGASPAELAFGRGLRTTLPSMPRNLNPQMVNRKALHQRDAAAKQRQKHYFDNRTGARELPELKPGDPVLIKRDDQKGWKVEARVLRKCAPRSYELQTPTGVLRRNRRHLLRRPGGGDESLLSSASFPHAPVPVSSEASPPPIPTDPAPPPSQLMEKRGTPPGHPPSSSSPPQAATPQGPPPAVMPKPQPTSTTAPPTQYTRSGRAVIKPARFQ